MNNPNAGVAGGGTGLGVLLVWLLGHFHVSLTGEEAAAIAGAIPTIILFIGREGLAGIWATLMHGKQKPPPTVLQPPAPPAAPPPGP